MTTTGAPTGTLRGTGIWAPDGKALADFYATALGWETRLELPDEHGDTVAHLISDGTQSLVFYTARDFKAPNWPQDGLPCHLDLAFDDVQAAEERLLALGAGKPGHQPGQGRWTVLLDRRASRSASAQADAARPAARPDLRMKPNCCGA
ncbi:VOC family protein [Streptomyces pinistramenti]|uniref:VOC family protein n=1 Tax=Streptomyces pinistramenti TaxID=2884812 RepID=UPI001D07E68E|nr:VOC family protein [Streptomyces pinistramenti]MCB5908951.1 VOC family protein [Streptomyces pinistramenti]